MASTSLAATGAATRGRAAVAAATVYRDICPARARLLVSFDGEEGGCFVGGKGRIGGGKELRERRPAGCSNYRTRELGNRLGKQPVIRGSVM